MKTKMRYYFTPVRVAIFKKQKVTKAVKREFLYTPVWKVNEYYHHRK
jgi:hypothetical protein